MGPKGNFYNGLLKGDDSSLGLILGERIYGGWRLERETEGFVLSIRAKAKTKDLLIFEIFLAEILMSQFPLHSLNLVRCIIADVCINIGFKNYEMHGVKRPMKCMYN